VTIVDLSSNNAVASTCYYFNFSQFFKYRESIDGVMVSGRKGETTVCINNYSPRYEQFKQSALVKSMPVGVRDPIYEEEHPSYSLSVTVEGMLLHPSMGINHRETALSQGHWLRFCTADLSQSSSSIKGELLSLIEDFKIVT
jgi:hypothetical protein